MSFTIYSTEINLNLLFFCILCIFKNGTLLSSFSVDGEAAYIISFDYPFS